MQMSKNITYYNESVTFKCPKQFWKQVVTFKNGSEMYK